VTKPDDPLLAAWRETLARRGKTPAFYDAGRAAIASFDQVEKWSRDYEDGPLQDLRPGEILAVQIGNHAHWPALLLGCLRRGIVVLPLERTMSDQERAAALRSCRVAALVDVAESGVRRLGKSEPVDWGEDPPVLLKLTSGTTAAPRAVRFRSGQLLADAVQICDTMGIGEDDLNYAVIPLSHSYGFSNLVTPLLVRGVPMAISTDRMPRAVLDGLERTGATVFPGMPLFFQAFAEMDAPPRLPRLRLCISAGAPLSHRVAENFRATFGLPIHSFYGASECGGICYDRTARNEAEGFVGPPLERVSVEPVDSESTSTQIRVTSAAVADGYFPEPEPEKLGRGVFVPDDLISIGEAGMRIVGRVSDVINVAGKKVNPAEVEAHLLSHAGVRQAVVFGRASALRNQEVVACVVAAEKINESVLLEYCRSRLSGWQVPKRIFLLDSMPANERGKISRRHLAERFAAA
jgi:long-chain acyl-CoA synthetase